MTGIFQWEEDTPVKEAVGQALGAASMCWSQIPTGVFDAGRAIEILEELMEFILRPGALSA